MHICLSSWLPRTTWPSLIAGVTLPSPQTRNRGSLCSGLGKTATVCVSCFSPPLHGSKLYVHFARFYFRLLLTFFCAAFVCVANMFVMSPGSVVKVTNRFIRRVGRLAEARIVWPDAPKRQERASYAWSTFGFRGCVGSVSGTTIPLAYASSYQPWTFWDRHDNYSMHLLVATDHQRNTISATLGFTGAAGDALVQRHAECERQPQLHFSHFENLLACTVRPIWFVPTRGKLPKIQRISISTFSWLGCA